MKINHHTVIVESNHWRYNALLPMECRYQRCKRLITSYPFLSKVATRTRIKVYHIECALILHIIE